MPTYIHTKEKYTFVRIPKTGSTSVKQAFFGKKFKRVFGPIPKEYAHYKSFTFVRHPFDRIVSIITMFKNLPCSKINKSNHSYRFLKNLNTDKILQLLQDDDIGIEKNTPYEELKLHALPMSHAHFSLENVDRIFKFEQFIKNWEELAEYLEVNTPKRVHRKRNSYEKLPLTEEEKEKIYNYYIKDFMQFEYKWK